MSITPVRSTDFLLFTRFRGSASSAFCYFGESMSCSDSIGKSCGTSSNLTGLLWSFVARVLHTVSNLTLLMHVLQWVQKSSSLGERTTFVEPFRITYRARVELLVEFCLRSFDGSGINRMSSHCGFASVTSIYFAYPSTTKVSSLSSSSSISNWICKTFSVSFSRLCPPPRSLLFHAMLLVNSSGLSRICVNSRSCYSCAILIERAFIISESSIRLGMAFTASRELCLVGKWGIVSYNYCGVAFIPLKSWSCEWSIPLHHSFC